ncbi:hypothetical protein CCHR01_04632 [Colletotrichum chrysophilum]|uniref:Uncharacterized protein n=1 Tax=Colletotrichum chrysophilum TaxID=1836956 RepID=A0AAD9EQC7_9PEZI|nr:hypothetical protein CCHR01_04632 [Colletotrichum chrysophilum]
MLIGKCCARYLTYVCAPHHRAHTTNWDDLSKQRRLDLLELHAEDNHHNSHKAATIPASSTEERGFPDPHPSAKRSFKGCRSLTVGSRKGSIPGSDVHDMAGCKYTHTFKRREDRTGRDRLSVPGHVAAAAEAAASNSKQQQNTLGCMAAATQQQIILQYLSYKAEDAKTKTP